jgi:hypothetical protein
MQGYPKHIAVRQDFLNLLAMPEFKDRAIEDLRAIYNLPDETAARVVSGSEEAGDLVTEEIENPMPLWKLKGFDSRQEVADLIITNGGALQ